MVGTWGAGSAFGVTAGVLSGAVGGVWLRLECLAGATKLQGFPDWYEFPNETATAGSIIGYSVQPSFATQLFTHIQKQLSGAFL
ncbi:hypothetical protein A6769_39200 [Nostoc punctiforme NIES-2108]|uniref:Uncharacterized protein n=1 Tax=Nostoc punctiforme NIES-2108 TaxID=1356359 RepID=A0A367RWQ3_NOSPU|nr:hypothetical protein A6769_39200 [Nostoc punctiforme NIES-2108]